MKASSSNAVERSPLLNRYLSDIRAFRVLSRDEEYNLARNVRTGCETSRNELIQSNLGFVVKIASEYRNFGLPFEDLLNEGNLGLIEAARRFDAGKGTKFITYAIWWIRKSIFRALSERSCLVRVPSYQVKKVREIQETEARLSVSLGRRPRREEISDKLERSLTKVDQALQFQLREVSLEQPVGQDREQRIADYLVDDEAATAEEALIRREDNDLVNQALSGLTAQEKAVVRYRFGFAGGRALTLKEVGALMNISRERVRQIECQAKRRMRGMFDERRAVPAPAKPPKARQGTRSAGPSPWARRG
jgi:RNA polymerase primary sigma factor